MLLAVTQQKSLVTLDNLEDIFVTYERGEYRVVATRRSPSNPVILCNCNNPEEGEEIIEEIAGFLSYAGSRKIVVIHMNDIIISLRHKSRKLWLGIVKSSGDHNTKGD